MFKRLTLAALALVLTAEAPPPILTPYIKDGRFDPGDYGWMRGNFTDATSAQKAEWRDLWAWRNRCRAEQFALIRAELAKRGVTPTPSIEESNGNGLCGSLAYARPHGDQGQSWPAFQATLARARPVAQAIVWSAHWRKRSPIPARPTNARC